MQLELVTLAGVKSKGEVYEVILPTPEGDIAVLPGHMPLVTLADNGVISIRRQRSDPDEAMEVFATFGGIVEVSPSRLRILVDEADTADDIIEEEARIALERATALRDEAGDRVELEKAQTMIDRQAVRLKVAGLRRRKRG